MSKSIRGSCLCGAVRFEVDPPFIQASHCHCERCRKHSGTAVCTQARVLREQFRLLQGKELIKVYGKGEGAVKGSVQIAVRVYSAAIGRTVRRYRFGWGRSMLIPEFGRNFILSSLIARRGIRSPMIFHSFRNDGPRESPFSSAELASP